MGEKKTPIIVIGHKNPDTDCIYQSKEAVDKGKLCGEKSRAIKRGDTVCAKSVWREGTRLYC